MSDDSNSQVLALLTEIRDQQKVALDRQKEHLELARDQVERSRNQVDESIGLQRHAMDRIKQISIIVIPLILLCVGLIVYLVLRFL